MCHFKSNPLAKELAEVEKRVVKAYRWLDTETNKLKIKKFYPVAEKLMERRGILRQRIENMERIKHAGNQ